MASRASLIQSRSIYVGTLNSVAPSDGNLIVTGDVGIGTTAPLYKLHVDDNNSYGGIFIEGDNAPGLSIRDNSGTSLSIIYVQSTAGSQGNLRISSDDNNTATTPTIEFLIGGSEKMRILDDGNVGIGTTNPSEKLHIDGRLRVATIDNGSGDFATISGTGVITRRTAAQVLTDIGAQSALTNPVTGTGTTNYVPKWTGASALGDSLMVSNSTGIGIGISNPTNRLYVQGQDSNNLYDNIIGVFRGAGTGTSNTAEVYIQNDAYDTLVLGSIGSNYSGSSWAGARYIYAATGDLMIKTLDPNTNLRFYTAGAANERMRITSAGNVGIGTTSPVTFGARNLDVNAGSGAAAYIVARANSNAGTIELAFDTDAGYLSTKSNHPLIVRTNDAERMRITSAGDVGIGTTNPNGNKLQVNGRIYTVGTAGQANAIFQGGQLEFYKDATPTYAASIGLSGPSSGSTNDIVFETYGGSWSERMRITAGGTVGINAANGLTTSTYAGKLAISDASGANLVLAAGTNTNNAIVSRIIGVNSNNGNSGNEGAAEFYGVTSIESAITTTDSNAGSDSGGYIMLKTKPEAGALVERMRIASNGVVRLNAYGSGGITGSPTYNLAVDASGDIIELPGGVVDGSGTANYVSKWSDANTLTNSVLYDDGTNVGIGNTAPTSKLHVSSTITVGGIDGSFLRTYASTDGNLRWAFVNDASGIFSIQQQGDNFVNQGDRIVINRSGNVGIGTTAPTDRLHVRVSDTYGAVRIGGGNGAGNSRIFIEANGDDNYIDSYGDNTHKKLTIAGSPIILSVGNVLVGTTTNSSFKLDVAGNFRASTSGSVAQMQTSTNASEVLRLSNSGGDSGSVQGITHLGINFFSVGTNSPVRITAYQNGTSGYAGGMYFSTRSVNSDSAPTEAMRITHDQLIGLGPVSSYTSTHRVWIDKGSSTYAVYSQGSIQVNAGAIGVGVTPSATSGRIDAGNDIVAYSTSDQRLKENITPIANALDKVKALTGVEFDWKEETKGVHGYEGHDVGVIAQEVQAVLPEAVRTNDSGYLSVRYEKMIALLVEANKELASRVEELEKKLK